VTLVRTEVSEKSIASIIRVERISELGILVVPLKFGTLQEPYGVTSQKTAFFILAAVKNSYLT
jgi:hypothetical protein